MNPPLSRIHRGLGAPVLVPLYHTVSDVPLPHIDPLYPVRTVRQFSQDLETLLAHYQPVGVDQLRKHVWEGIPFSRPSFHLTFDDGLRACAETIAPLLTRYGVPATFFLNPPMLDNRALMFRYKAALLAGKTSWKSALSLPYAKAHMLETLAAREGIDWAAFLDEEKPYMTTAQVDGLVRAGFSIGAHSNAHPLMPEIAATEALQETLHSWQWIEERFPEQAPAFAFPFTATGMAPAFWQQLQAQRPGPWLTFGTAGLKRHFIPWHLERFPVEKSRKALSSQLLRAYAAWLVKMPLGKNRIGS